ncbi:TIGR03826 family flagellar region protein [Anaerosalibacter sp. Marseille-P3206]|uniref:TIGR03826 family flagellar region protein n=1 Tax=Anaerosalibacter sp. Marseille-P3206 TaxID=1871005 RepID=UPI000987CD2B|nr:TIGR03826 family flagellar region protein [Anaerosalibacter sp. Marseille-P3206]
MDVRNCTRCGNIYVYDNFKICPKCRREDEKDFQTIKEYIDEYPDANITEVSEETGVDTQKIIAFLKEGRLEIKGDNNIFLACERCGQPIKTGRFCDKCTLEMQKEMREAIGGRKDPSELHTGELKQRLGVKDRRRN